MELETDDPVKSQLLTKTARYREELEEEAKVISDRTEKIIKNALIIGGSLALAYFAYKQLSGSKKKKVKAKQAPKPASAVSESDIDDDSEESSSPNLITQIGTALASQASVLLLNLAKEKLSEYLQAQAEKKKDEHS
jgi:uncharacterized membrane protein YebE (DUF533 family)